MTRQNRIALGIVLTDLAATLALYPRLPEQIPVHWGIHGADAFGSRWQIFLLGPALMTLIFLLTLGLARIDPLASRPLPPDAPPAEQGAFGSMQIALLGLCAIFQIGIMLQLAHLVIFDPRLTRLMAPAMLILMGNFLPRVRPNYFAGIRTPWTLASESVWRRTNRLAGKLLFYGGLLCVPLVLFSAPAAGYGFVVVGLGAIAASCIASYLWWRQEQQTARS
jgi:uncharacterized membrane protein